MGKWSSLTRKKTQPWRGDPVTGSQRNLIDNITSLIHVEFKGKNKGDAADFIDKYLSSAQSMHYCNEVEAGRLPEPDWWDNDEMRQGT